MSSFMQCKSVKENNEECNSNAVVDSDYCFSHNPQTRAAKQAAVVKGGLASHQPRVSLEEVPIANVADVVALLARTINEVRANKIDLKAANCIGFLAGHLVKAIEISELENKINKIEKIISPDDSRET